MRSPELIFDLVDSEDIRARAQGFGLLFIINDVIVDRDINAIPPEVIDDLFRLRRGLFFFLLLFFFALELIMPNDLFVPLVAFFAGRHYF